MNTFSMERKRNGQPFNAGDVDEWFRAAEGIAKQLNIPQVVFRRRWHNALDILIDLQTLERVIHEASARTGVPIITEGAWAVDGTIMDETLAKEISQDLRALMVSGVVSYG